MKIKSVNALMKYLRDKKKIAISGHSHKRKLRQIGYYHGYKGFRFFNRPNKPLVYSHFNDLLSVYQFDLQLKTILYPVLMQIETALKNFALEVILTASGSEKFTDVYFKVLNRHNDFPRTDKKYREYLSKELYFRNRVYGNLSRDYGTKLLVQHFYEKDLPVPIWAIFEILSLGEFGTLLSCTNSKCAKLIGASVGLNTAYDSDGLLLTKIVYAIKDLRNAVAHNDPVFDIRFRTSGINSRIATMLTQAIGISNITFSTITDYVILLSYILKCLKFPKTEIRKFIYDYAAVCDELIKKVPFPLSSTVLHTDNRNKIATLQKWL